MGQVKYERQDRIRGVEMQTRIHLFEMNQPTYTCIILGKNKKKNKTCKNNKGRVMQPLNLILCF